MANAEHVWAVPADHPAFAGHFPGRPIVPGVVLLDQALRFAQALCDRHGAGWQVGNAKFLSPVGPGETLLFSLDLTPRGSVAFSVTCGERAVASGSLIPPAA